MVGVAEQRQAKTADTQEPVGGEDKFAEPAGADAAGPAVSNSAGEAQGGRSGPQFLFYRRLERLDAKSHGTLGLAARSTYKFAEATNSVPLNAVEFLAAARHYPIVFSAEDGMPLAVIGFRAKQNLFIEDDGSWAEGCYIPAFVRRYPFLLLTRSGSEEIAFCIDAETDMLVNGSDRKLFSEGKPSELMQNAARFCSAFAREQSRTRQFAALLREKDLLIERSADVTLPTGEKIALRGFRIVDENRLRNLPDDLLADWCRRGWTGWINSHAVSLGNFGRLYHRAKLKG